jgi:hypothetical protein
LDSGCDGRRAPTGGLARHWKLAATCMLGAFFVELVSARGATFDPDGYHGMALFRYWLRTGVFPLGDVFAFTPTVFPVVHHEWGAGALMYVYVTWLGAGGVMAIRWALAAAIFVVAARLALRRASPVVVAFCAPLAITLADIGFTTIRAGVYTLLLVAIFLTMIEGDRTEPRQGRFLLSYVALMTLWINLHAGWVVGFVAVACHALEQALRRRPIRHLVAALATTPALMLATPYGRYYPVGWWRSVSYARDRVPEWAPLMNTPHHAAVFAVLLALLLVVYAAVRRGPRALPGLLFLAATAYAAWRHQRHLPLFALTWVCAVPAYLTPTLFGEMLESALARRRVAGAVTLAALPVVAALLFVSARYHPMTLVIPAQGRDAKEEAGIVYPTGAVDHLGRVHFRGKLFTEFATGAYVSWKLHPDVRVSLDGRYEVAYADGVLEEEMTLYHARPGWREILTHYRPEGILLRPSFPLDAALASTPDTGFVQVYADDVFRVWARRDLNLPVVSRTGQPIPSFFP